MAARVGLFLASRHDVQEGLRSFRAVVKVDPFRVALPRLVGQFPFGGLFSIPVDHFIQFDDVPARTEAP